MSLTGTQYASINAATAEQYGKPVGFPGAESMGMLNGRISALATGVTTGTGEMFHRKDEPGFPVELLSIISIWTQVLYPALIVDNELNLAYNYRYRLYRLEQVVIVVGR